ncbi:hypothetical protein B0H19DRAFT_1175283 [Mycena capillaripes]|nr:hypothetical protein B0H19DRAFT_1175283 [Mycena capillaripes]
MAQAAQEKEKGNAAFKAGDYPTAIGHYSAAIHADRTDATFPLNRAAAYLKLGKNEDAERDCSTVLTLSKGNVKALFRRAQARIGMGKLSEAQADLKEAVKLEPANQSVKLELNKVVELIQQAAAASAKKSKTVPVDLSSTNPTPKRRRIPITIVEPDGRRSTPTPVDAPNASPAPAASSTPKTTSIPAPKTNTTEAADLMKPVSSRQLNASSSNVTTSSTAAAPPTSTAQPTAKPSSFKDAKSARDSSKPSRVGGGIFRASGESTIFTPREGKPAPTKQEATPPKPEPIAKPAVPPAKQNAVPTAPVKQQTVTSTPDPSAKQAATPAKQDAPPLRPTSTPHVPVLATPASTPSAKTKSPMSLFDFTRAWERAPDPPARFALLSQIPPAALPALFQTSLEPALFAEIVDTLGVVLPSADVGTVAAYMRAFPGVARFGTVVRFLSRAEKARVRAVWGELGVGVVEGDGMGLPPSQLEEAWGAVYR